MVPLTAEYLALAAVAHSTDAEDSSLSNTSLSSTLENESTSAGRTVAGDRSKKEHKTKSIR